jgi:transporter family-2 protein
MEWLLVLFAILSGAANPLQAGANAQLNRSTQHPVWAGVAVYAFGLAGMLLIQLFVRDAFPLRTQLAAAPWWAWFGGFISIASTMAGLMFAQRLGSGVFTGASITAALVCSLLLDHMGWLGFSRHAASPMRLVGAALMISGLWCIARF